jgi:hypothetical protein
MNLPVAVRTGRLGGYGAAGEVIFEAQPAGCPSVLVDARGDATATFMTNGSTGFTVKIPEGLEVRVLEGSFDAVEKRETGLPSTGCWLALAGGARRRLSLPLQPSCGLGCRPESSRAIKLGDPDRSMWFCASYRCGALAWNTVLCQRLVLTATGPALLRQLLVENTGRRRLRGRLWTAYALPGTQRFVYNKNLWYDHGLPLSGRATVAAASVPYSEIVQLKLLVSRPSGMRPLEATCDYSQFVGDSGRSALLPAAVAAGKLLARGAGDRLSRFAVPVVAANAFALDLAPGRFAVLEQSLLYVTDRAAQARFRRLSESADPSYPAISAAFARAARDLARRTAAPLPPRRGSGRETTGTGAWPAFEFTAPREPAVSQYARSIWTGVRELYENCRAHGARMAEGIELGTRDRAQDMWPMMKEDPGRVRADLVHAFGFMYVTRGGGSFSRPLSLPDKLHGLYPRQYPSRWDDRTREVHNDNRPYADSPLWLINSLCRYLRETGDVSVLTERVGTVRLTDQDHPESSGLVGGERTQTVLQAALGILDCFERLADEAPCGMAQILYGDWCDPIDMFGTSRPGDAATRGRGRGVQTRLSAHLFQCLVELSDLLEAPDVARAAGPVALGRAVRKLRAFACRLRGNVIRWAWEPGRLPGFLDCIHELRSDGTRPDWRRGETGYTLGSMRGRDYDGRRRRVLASQAYGLMMLTTDRSWLPVPEGRDAMVAGLLRTVDRLFHRPELGLMLFSTPIANTKRSVELAGRMGVLPAGCAENGEYHHAQVMMHLFRLGLPGQADTAWRQFRAVISATRGDGLGGPFDMPATSYVAADGDPHFGKGMYFGLSGSTDWIVDIFESVAGLELNLHDRRQPAVRVNPRLPAALGGEVRLRRIIHDADGRGGFRRIPVEIVVRRAGGGKRGAPAGRSVLINGQPADRAEVTSLRGLKSLKVEIISG